jgi:ribosome biogenesis GTPase A
MIDTPGLINRGQLTSKLTPEELRDVIPTKPINAITLRVTEGKCVLIGGLATIELVEGLPFFFTFFISNNIKLHPTDSERAHDFVDRHIGSLIFPPATKERLADLGPFESHEMVVEGDSWKHSLTDIVIAGLGWIAVTGTGKCKVKVTVPTGTGVTLRSSLMPFEASHSTAKFTGGRIEKKSKRSGSKSYGWRA